MKEITREVKDHEVARLASMLQAKVGKGLADKWNRDCVAAGNPPIYDSGDCRGMLVSTIKLWRTEMGREPSKDGG